ncbi:hypothetical protein SUGI_0439530 [Cryptomeria japonica]|uniref:putative UPF0481 protein At3g02645 n=1 Tax=Cryptomeria japonica TaxID=3369 RepID=UPI0024089929|nr:putative UPF0481 protein At3g02645 [Cryptomeria japonica]GLJ23235.1 hypothetical protein SUGI_0439530 [Cryptomeria japonica]
MALVGSSDELISDEWIAEVQKIVEARDGDGSVSVGTESKRVPEVVAEAKADAYAPLIVSLGPYYYRALRDAPVGPLHHGLSIISQMEMYKLKYFKDAVRNDPERICEFLENTVQPNKSKLEQFYNWKLDTQEDFRKFGWMMMVDSFFLYQFLKDACDQAGQSRLPSATGSIKCDIVKLENQLPLFLLNQAHDHLTLNGDGSFDELLKRQMASLCSFDKFECSSVKNEGEEKHLLAYMHKCVSSFLQMEEEKHGSNCFQESQIAIGGAISIACRTCCFPQARAGRSDFKINARKLVKHGITLTPFILGKSMQQIRFDRYSGTLYLPKLTVTDMFTEVVLRNLLALEFIETNRGTVITQYVELMKSLIDTAKDVKVLRKCGVIVPGSSMISDDYIAAMWKDICKPFFAASVHPSLQFEHIKESLNRKYYIVKGKAVCLAKGFCLVQTPFKLVKGICMVMLG